MFSSLLHNSQAYFLNSGNIISMKFVFLKFLTPVEKELAFFSHSIAGEQRIGECREISVYMHLHPLELCAYLN